MKRETFSEAIAEYLNKSPIEEINFCINTNGSVTTFSKRTDTTFREVFKEHFQDEVVFDLVIPHVGIVYRHLTTAQRWSDHRLFEFAIRQGDELFVLNSKPLDDNEDDVEMMILPEMEQFDITKINEFLKKKEEEEANEQEEAVEDSFIVPEPQPMVKSEPDRTPIKDNRLALLGITREEPIVVEEGSQSSLELPPGNQQSLSIIPKTVMRQSNGSQPLLSVYINSKDGYVNTFFVEHSSTFEKPFEKFMDMLVRENKHRGYTYKDYGVKFHYNDTEIRVTDTPQSLGVTDLKLIEVTATVTIKVMFKVSLMPDATKSLCYRVNMDNSLRKPLKRFLNSLNLQSGRFLYRYEDKSILPTQTPSEINLKSGGLIEVWLQD